MKKYKNISILLSIVSIFFICLLIRSFVSDHLNSFGTFFILKKVTNHGFLLGHFSEVSSLLKIMFIFSILGFLYFLSLFVFFFLSTDFFYMKIGLSLMLGGFTSNAIEKLLYGYVIDYVAIKSPFLNQYFFNLADFFQLIGFVIAIRSVLKNKTKIWFADEKRINLILNPVFQFRFVKKIIIFFILMTVFLGAITFAAMEQLFEFSLIEERLIHDYRLMFFMTYVSMSLFFIIIMIFFLLRISHKIIGPLYVLKKFILNPNKQEIVLRENDYFQDIVKEINESLRSNSIKTSPTPPI
jgi:lipoprotein signal peptidase